MYVPVTHAQDDIPDESDLIPSPPHSDEDAAAQQQQHETMTTHTHTGAKKEKLFLFRSRTQKELLDDGYTCFVTGECMDCTAEEMVCVCVCVCVCVRVR